MNATLLVFAPAFLAIAAVLSPAVSAQDSNVSSAADLETAQPNPPHLESTGVDRSASDPDSATDSTSEASEKASEIAAETQATVEEFAEKVDQSETAQKAADGILGPIYKLAESLNFVAFHWLAFATMASGVVSFSLQLVLGKLALLFRGSLNLREIFSDAVGLIISLVGLVLTTQAAAENSTFTHRPAAVLSAAATGILLGFVLYRWGQAQEVNALTGSRLTPNPR